MVTKMAKALLAVLALALPIGFSMAAEPAAAGSPHPSCSAPHGIISRAWPSGTPGYWWVDVVSFNDRWGDRPIRLFCHVSSPAVVSNAPYGMTGP